MIADTHYTKNIILSMNFVSVSEFPFEILVT